jgi:hypothetical protein
VPGQSAPPVQSAAPAGLYAALVQALRPSAIRIAADEGTFVQLLREDIGQLARRLPGGGWRLCERTARTVLWLAIAEQPPEAIGEALQWLAEINQADGFPVSEYVTVGQALVRVTREMAGTSWTSTMGSSWIQLFMWMQPYLRAGAQSAAAQAAAVEATAAQPTAALAPEALAPPAEEAQRQQAPATQVPAQRPADANVSSVASLLDDENDEGDSAYNEVSYARPAHRRIPFQRRPAKHE